MQKPALTQLIDQNGDGITDEYRTVCNQFGVTPDFMNMRMGWHGMVNLFMARWAWPCG